MAFLMEDIAIVENMFFEKYKGKFEMELSDKIKKGKERT